MRIFALSSFVLPGAQVAEQGEVYDLPDKYAIEAIGLGNAEHFTDPPEVQDTPKPKSKKGTADV